MVKLLLSTLLLLSLPAQAEAAEYCHEEDLVLDREALWDFSAGFSAEQPLPTHRAGELVPSMGRAVFGSTGDQQLHTAFENSGLGSFGIEYMVYKLEISIGDPLDADHQVFVEDFSRDCTDPGLAVDYGRRRSLPPLAILPRRNGEPRGVEKVRVRVWGWQ
jgi:hypothetical protein